MVELNMLALLEVVTQRLSVVPHNIIQAEMEAGPLKRSIPISEKHPTAMGALYLRVLKVSSYAIKRTC